MTEATTNVTAREGFAPPPPDARYFLCDEGAWTTYGEMTAGIDPAMLPRDEGDLRLLLVALGALSEEEMEAARYLYEALLRAAAARIRLHVPREVIDAASFEEAFPALRGVLATRSGNLLEQALLRMLGEGDGPDADE